MARCSRCDCPDVTECLCSADDSDCIAVSGTGTAADPFTFDPVLDPDTENLIECGPSGLAAFLPSEIAEPPRCQIRKSLGQTIPSSTLQVASFDVTPAYDTANMYDGAVNAFRMNITMDGLYIIHAAAGWEEPASSAFASFVVTNQPSNTDLLSHESSIANGPGAPWWRTYISNDIELDAGTYIELRVFQNTGSDLELIGAVLTARRVAPKAA